MTNMPSSEQQTVIQLLSTLCEGMAELNRNMTELACERARDDERLKTLEAAEKRRERESERIGDHRITGALMVASAIVGAVINTLAGALDRLLHLHH
jgi:hypothetical protein